MPVIFLVFLLAVGLVLTSAKKQKKRKTAKVKKSRVIQPTVVQKPQIVQPAEPTVQPAEPVVEVKNEEVSPPTPAEGAPTVAETPAASVETVPAVQPVIQPAETQVQAPPVESIPQVAPPPVVKDFPKEEKKSGEFTNIGKVKITISPVDEWPEMTPEDRISDLRAASTVLRPFYVKDYPKDQYEQLVKDSEEYLRNPIAFDQSKAVRVKDFLESLKNKRNEVSSKGEVEYIGPLD